MFLTTPQLVATFNFLCPTRPAASILYFTAPHDQRRAFFIAPCYTRMSGQRWSDGNIELVTFLDSHEGDGARAVFAIIIQE